MKILNKIQKEKEVKRQLKKMIKECQDTLLKKSIKALNSGAIPERFMLDNDHLLAKAIFDSFCADRPYQMIDKSYRLDAENIHKFI